MTEHERACFNEALHKLQVRDAELRVRRKLDCKLNRVPALDADEQLPYLFKIEEALV